MRTIEIQTIGVLKTEHKTIENMPIQPVGAKGLEGVAEIDKEFEEGLLDLEDFSHIILIYHLHEVQGYSLKVIPFMDTVEHGIFATRSPKRPSHLGISIVKLIKIESNKVFFEGADMLDNTPLFDIKPYFRVSDSKPDAVCGWLDEKDETMAQTTKSDKRFGNEV